LIPTVLTWPVRMRHAFKVRSSWFFVRSEFTVNAGLRTPNERRTQNVEIRVGLLKLRVDWNPFNRQNQT